MLTCEGVCGFCFLLQILIDRFSVGMIIGQRRVDLGERKVSNPLSNVFGRMAEAIPLHDPSDGHARPSNACPTAPNVGTPVNEAVKRNG